MKIEKIIKQKNSKYKLIFEDGSSLITYDEVVLNHNLLFHKEIDDETYHILITDSNYYQIYNDSIKYISKRLRSELEVRKYIEKKTLDLYLIDDIINKLKEKKYIDDERFANAYTTDKLNFSNCGILKIKQELIHLGITDDIINNVCDNINNSNDKLKKLIDKKIQNNHKYSNYYLKQKILNDLLNMGYEREEIHKILDSYTIDDNEIRELEYKKIYHKLKYKYNGKELEYQINLKLHAKGFK